MKIFLSLSDRMCLMKAQPVPMRAMVMKRRAPFSLEEKQAPVRLCHSSSSAQALSSHPKAAEPLGNAAASPRSRCTCTAVMPQHCHT